MKKIAIIILNICTMCFFAFGNEERRLFVKTDWFLEGLNRPVKSVKEVITDDFLHLMNHKVYSREGFKKLAIQKRSLDNNEIFEMIYYYQPYRGNGRNIVMAPVPHTVEDVQRNLASLFISRDNWMEKWLSPHRRQVNNDLQQYTYYLNKYGDVQSVDISSPFGHKKLHHEYTYINDLNLVDLNSINEGQFYALITESDEFNNWIKREIYHHKGVIIEERVIEYYED